MITQIILDAATYWVAGALALFPQLPEVGALVASWVSGMNTVAATTAPLGAIVPFMEIRRVLDFFLVVLAWWLAVLPIKFVFWLVGRG